MLPSIFLYLHNPEEVLKTAQEHKEESPMLRGAKTVGAGALGLAGGTLLGYGAGRLVEKAHGGPLPAKHLASIGSLAGAGLGLTYGLYRAHETEELRRVFESSRNKPPGGVPPK